MSITTRRRVAVATATLGVLAAPLLAQVGRHRGSRDVVPPNGQDPTRWSTFWEFRKDSFLWSPGALHDSGPVRFSDGFFMGSAPRDVGDTPRPTEDQVLGEVVPALHRTLQSTQQRDITSACLVALAKIGREDSAHLLLPALRARLTSHDQEIRETAALTLGP